MAREDEVVVLPRHLGLIPDGNRRWARLRGLSIAEAYRIGADRAEEIVYFCFDVGIKVVTLYVLSAENLLRRGREERRLLLDLIKERLAKVRGDERTNRRGVRVKVIGERSLLPEDVLREALATEEATRMYANYYLNLAIAYSGQLEIVNAVNQIVDDVRRGRLTCEKIDENTFRRYLYVSDVPHPFPDLVIRTGGERRLSGFLLYEIAYSELIFVDKYWPDFTKDDLMQALIEYQRRERRFGR